jgi:cellulose synthase/poly-beta-1,6-N-acetylglucosamine synthase-like glycosyltransferase
VAQGDVILLLHADTLMPPGAARAALNCLRDDLVVGEGFGKRITTLRRCWRDRK